MTEKVLMCKNITDIIAYNYLECDDYEMFCRALTIKPQFDRFFKNKTKFPKLSNIVRNDRECIELYKYIFNSERHQFNTERKFDISLGETFDDNDTFEKQYGEYNHNDIDIACENGHINIIKFLYEKNVPIATSATDFACANGHIKLVLFLWDIFPTVEKMSEDAPMFAATNGHLEVVKFLLDMAIFDSEIEDIMKHVIENDHYHIIESLIQDGRTFNEKEIACYMSTKMWQLLVSHRNNSVDITKMLNSNTNLSEIKYLISIGAKPNINLITQVINKIIFGYQIGGEEKLLKYVLSNNVTSQLDKNELNKTISNLIDQHKNVLDRKYLKILQKTIKI
jgi:hypothetical protein